MTHSTELATGAPRLWQFVADAIRSVKSEHPHFAELVYIVGGAVRDYLLWGRTGPDLDIVVERSGGAEILAVALAHHWKDRASQPHALGQGYPIWQIILELPEEFRNDVGAETLEIQIADTQSEMFPDPATRQRRARFGNLFEDCARRDFTVNMLYWSCEDARVVDPSGAGLTHLREGFLAAHPQVDATKMFRDDPLRMLRLLRFRSKLGFEVDPRLWPIFDAEFDRISILSAERVRDEILKLLPSGGLVGFLETLRERGHLKTLFPEFIPMIGCGQDRTYHSEGDVWTHTMMVISQAPRTPALQLAALLHDTGKPATRSAG